MRVLVTGADGFVGQHLVEALLTAGHEVVGGITGPEPRLATLSEERAAQVQWRAFDLLDPPSIHDLIASSDPDGVFHLAGVSSVSRSWKHPSDPDGVFHLAGVSSVSRSWKHPEHTFDTNAKGALHLLLALRDLPAPESEHPRPVLLVGSGEAYGRDGTEETPLHEGMTLQPLTPYGASKGAQEMLGWSLGDHAHTRLIQTRSFPQIGPGQKPMFVTADWARQLIAIRRGDREPVLRVGHLDAARDFLDVREAAAAYMALFDCATARGVYNVCSGRAYTLRHLLSVLQEVVGVRVEVEVDPERLRPADIQSLVGDPGRLRDETGWSPRRSLEEMLRDIVDDVERAMETDGTY